MRDGINDGGQISLRKDLLCTQCYPISFYMVQCVPLNEGSKLWWGLTGSHFHHKAPQFFTKDNNVVLMVTRNVSCSWQLSYSLNAATEKLTHIGRAWGENHYKPKISTANLCSCQNIWCKSAKLSLRCHILAPTQMIDILTMTVSKYLLLHPVLQSGKVSTQNA